MIKLSELMDTSNLSFVNIKQADALEDVVGIEDPRKLAELMSKYITELLFGYVETEGDEEKIKHFINKLVELPEGEWVLTILKLIELGIKLEERLSISNEDSLILKNISLILSDAEMDEEITMLDFAGGSYFYADDLKRETIESLLLLVSSLLAVDNIDDEEEEDE